MTKRNAGHMLAEWRNRAGYTQEEAAHRLGLTQGSISKLERGLVLPSLPAAGRIQRGTKGKVPVGAW